MSVEHSNQGLRPDAGNQPAMSIDATHGWLQSTLSADQTQRRAAEEALKQSEFAAEHVVHLFRIAADTSVAVDVALRQAAAIRMKTVISRGWDPASSSADGKVLGATDKAAVRDNLVEAMVVAVPVVRTQLGLCLRSIAQVDYPDNWPGLISAICANMQQQNMERVRSQCLHALCMYACARAVHGRAHWSSQLRPHPRPKASPGLWRALRATHARQGVRVPAGGRPRAAARRGRAACSRRCLGGATPPLPPPPAAVEAERRVWAALRAPDGRGRAAGRYRRQWQPVVLLPSSLCSRRSCWPLHLQVEQTWPLMAQLVDMLIATPSVEGAELALLAMKVFWSATQINLPPLLLRPDQLAVWMRLLIGLLEQPLPPGAPEDLEAAEAWRPWKVKKRVAQIVHRLLQRYGVHAPRTRRACPCPCALHSPCTCICPARQARAVHPPILRVIWQATPSASATGLAQRRRPLSRSSFTTTG